MADQIVPRQSGRTFEAFGICQAWGFLPTNKTFLLEEFSPLDLFWVCMPNFSFKKQTVKTRVFLVGLKGTSFLSASPSSSKSNPGAQLPTNLEPPG